MNALRVVLRQTNGGLRSHPDADDPEDEAVPIVIWSLTLGGEYEVIEICCDDYRIVDDKGEPYLFDPRCFDVVDATEPRDWVSTIDDGVRYAGPKDWGRGFFERWHDGDATTREEFRKVHRRIYGRDP